ncbi:MULTISPECIES: DMT family transporter [unclassified Arthrobacter]|uniref:EamA family transporter n=1 Tax=unclassified Arthrobacter TaxID=235627 RepID=UPI001E44F75A|nr:MULTISPECIES: DMT family transporter [unclassified Arthrobacter]MCC9144367.1 DMT family transporter [Arthrobacter sp. zg-Y919]MDK1275593.1 DMT family transporter [Arthrobacter sp. zg.Y919]WIB03038.1 DMT family transporter [Arthrobacter sp. zg-Y919]
MARARATPGRLRPGAAGILVALASSSVFGLSGSFAKSLLETGWTSTGAVAVRMLGAALVLAIPAAVALHGRWSQVWTNWRTIVVFGFIGVAGCQFFYFNAVERLSVGVALLLEFLAPVLMVLWLWAVTRRRPGLRTVLGAVAAVAGLVLVLDLGGSIRVDPVGVLWGLAAAVCLAGYFFITAKQNDSLPPLVLATGGMFVGGATMAVLGLTGVLPMAVSTADVELGGWQTAWWVPVAGLVLFSTVLAYVTGIIAARSLGSRVASFVSLTEVLFAVLWAWLLLAELPRPVQLAGGVLIVAGVVLVRSDETAGLPGEATADVEPYA